MSNKSKIATLLLCVFFGYFGLHRFYVGKNKSAILYIFTFGLFGIGWIADFVNIANNLFTDSAGCVIGTESNTTLIAFKPKKPAQKTWLFWIVIVFVYAIIGALQSEPTSQPTISDTITTDPEFQSIVDTNTSETADIETDPLETDLDKFLSKEETETDTDTETEAESEVESKTENADTDTETSKDNNESVTIEYDTLQEIFLSVDKSLLEDELLAIIEENDLAYTSQKYNGTPNEYVRYKVAYSEKTAQQSRADEGDYLKFSFGVNTDKFLLEVSYYNNEHGISVEYNEIQTNEVIKYTDYSHSPILREDGSKSGLVEMNYWEADSLEEALISALMLKKESDTNSEVSSSKISSEVSSTVSETITFPADLPEPATTFCFILNTDSGKFHLPSCHKGQEILPEHREERYITDVVISDSIQRLINEGYSPCGICLD